VRTTAPEVDAALGLQLGDDVLAPAPSAADRRSGTVGLGVDLLEGVGGAADELDRQIEPADEQGADRHQQQGGGDHDPLLLLPTKSMVGVFIGHPRDAGAARPARLDVLARTFSDG
jgi:hypothetical protein